MTQGNVFRHFEWHAAKVTRIETARVAVTVRDVKDLFTLYSIRDEEHRDGLVESARLPVRSRGGRPIATSRGKAG